MNTNAEHVWVLKALQASAIYKDAFDALTAAIAALKEADSNEAWAAHPETLAAKAQWDEVAACLGADGDNPDAVRAAARKLAALSGDTVRVSVKYASEASKKNGWKLDPDWFSSLEPKDAEHWPGLEETEAVILALLAAAPQTEGEG